jgi:RND superfamily putative drug exporter
LLVGLAALPFAAQVNDHLDASVRLIGSESAQVEAALRDRFKSPFTTVALLRVTGAPAAPTTDGRMLLGRLVAALRDTPGVQGVMSYLDRKETLFIGTDASPILIVGLNAAGAGLSAAGSGDAIMAKLRAATAALGAEWAGRYPTLTFQWTGEAAVNADLRRLSAQETRAAELRALPFTLVLLLIAFRSVAAAAVPIVCGALTVLVSLGTIGAINRLWPVSVIVEGIVSMVGLGLSIDYALLLVSRYRDALDSGSTRAEAVRQATDHAGRTVVVSGSAVAIGFAAMLLIRVSEIRSIGIGGLIVTVVAVLVARTLVPVVLVVVGPRIDGGSFGFLRQRSTRHWRRWAQWVAEHPIRVLVVAGIPVALLAAQSAHMRFDLPRGRWLPENADSVRVLHDMDAVTRGNFGQIVEIILDLPPSHPVQTQDGWLAESRLVRTLARDARIQHVWAVTTMSPGPLAGPEVLAQIPDAVRRSLVTDDGQAAVIQLLPRPGLAASDASSLVRDIRSMNIAAITGLAGTRIQVGGIPGFNADYADAIQHSIGAVVLGVVGATLLVLSIAFRSVLIPLKAVALNLLSVAGAFGAVTLVFQDGIGAWVVGLPHAMHGSFPIVPVLIFCIVFGLSMDYEVFIVARIADARRAGLTDREALVEGLAGSGRVVTFAAAIMVMIFGGFIFGDFILIKILGFALGVAVLLDATVIRLGLGPAFIRLAGGWNWWPGR